MEYKRLDSDRPQMTIPGRLCEPHNFSPDLGGAVPLLEVRFEKMTLDGE